MEANNDSPCGGGGGDSNQGNWMVRIKEEPQDEDSNSTSNMGNADVEPQHGSGTSFSFNTEDMNAALSAFAGLGNEADQVLWKNLADTFTNEDLVAVGVDHDSPLLMPDLNLSEHPESGSSNDSQTFISLGSSGSGNKQIQGSEVRNVAGGDDVFVNIQNQIPCLRLMLNSSGKMEQAGVTSGGTSKQPQSSSDQVQINAGGGGARGMQVTNVRITNVGDTDGDNSSKGRKPRGRKPKYIKVGERNAAKAAETEGNGMDLAPNVVVHHTAANYPPPIQNNATYSVPGGSHQIQNNGNCISLRAFSMNDSVAFDRNTTLTRRHANGIEINAVPETGANRATFCDATVGQAGMNLADVNGIFRRNNGIAERGNHIQPGQSVGNNQQSNDRQVKMEQLFSSRISSVGAPRRSIVTPSYIQRNMSLYTQLTAPTPKTQSDFDQGKLTQDKWMQYPNPSGAPSCSSTARMTEGGIFGNTIATNGYVQKPIEPSIFHNYGNAAPAPTPGNNSGFQNGISNPSINIIHGTNDGARNGTSRPPTNFNDSTIPGFVPLQINPSNVNPQPQYNGLTSNRISKTLAKQHAVIQELQTRVQMVSLDNFELKLKMHFTSRTNKDLLGRLRCSLHETEMLKFNNQQLQMQLEHPSFYTFSNNNTGVSSATGNDSLQNQNRSNNGTSVTEPCSSTGIRIKQEPEDGVNAVTDGDSREQSTQLHRAIIDDASRGIPGVMNLKRNREEEPHSSAAPNKRQCTDEDEKSTQ